MLKNRNYYAVSEMFEVKEPVATEEYKAWLGEWTFVGDNGAEYFYTNQEGDYYIAIAGILDDGQRALVRYGRTGIEGYPVFTQMFYMAEFSDGYYSLTDENEIPTFPAAINPYEAPQSRKGMMKSKRMASVPTVKTIASKRPMK